MALILNHMNTSNTTHSTCLKSILILSPTYAKVFQLTLPFWSSDKIIICQFLVSPIRTKWSIHLLLLQFILGKEYNWKSSSSITFLHYSVNLCFLVSNIQLGAMFSNALNPCLYKIFYGNEISKLRSSLASSVLQMVSGLINLCT